MPGIENYIKSWYELDKKINEKNKEILVIKENKNKLGDLITQYLIKNKLSDNLYKINNHKIQCISKETRESFSQSYIKKNLAEYFKNNPSIADNLYNYLLNNRKVTSNISLIKSNYKD